MKAGEVIWHAGSDTAINNSGNVIFFCEFIEVKNIFGEEGNINDINFGFNNIDEGLIAEKSGDSRDNEVGAGDIF